jgi:hypothetical protein
MHIWFSKIRFFYNRKIGFIGWSVARFNWLDDGMLVGCRFGGLPAGLIGWIGVLVALVSRSV